MPSVHRVRVADDCHRAELPHRTACLLCGKCNVVKGELSRELEAFGVGLAVIIGPVVVRAGERGGQLGIEVVVHLDLPTACAVEDGDIDPFDVHRLQMRLRVELPGDRDVIVRVAGKGPPAEVGRWTDRIRCDCHVSDDSVLDTDRRLIRRSFWRTCEGRGELLEWLLQVAEPKIVRFHRMQIAVQYAKSIFHSLPPRGRVVPNTPLVHAQSTVYKLGEKGELARTRIVNSIRIAGLDAVSSGGSRW